MLCRQCLLSLTSELITPPVKRDLLPSDSDLYEQHLKRACFEAGEICLVSLPRLYLELGFTILCVARTPDLVDFLTLAFYTLDLPSSIQQLHSRICSHQGWPSSSCDCTYRPVALTLAAKIVLVSQR